MEKYIELDDPVKEVYRKREAIMKRFNYDIKAYHKYLRDKLPELEKLGFKQANRVIM
jgi:iron-sulfur cluster repair protein YtfE (RIC family)